MKIQVVIFTALCMLFLVFSYMIYSVPLHDNSAAINERAGEGRLVWQKYNCQACHQLYGLGGYLGPDLTNVISEKGKGAPFVMAMVRSGTDKMPAFRMTPEEVVLLLEFLRAADTSGRADPRSFTANIWGMIRQK